MRSQNNTACFEVPIFEAQRIILTSEFNSDDVICQSGNRYCIIDVLPGHIEHRISLNNSHTHLLTIQAGDKIWFSWENSYESKSIFQVDLTTNPKEKFLFQRKLHSAFLGDLERLVKKFAKL